MRADAIARAVLDSVARHADGRQVTRIELTVGDRHPVAAPALESALVRAATGTPVAGAAIAIEPSAGDELRVASIELDDRGPTGGWRCRPKAPR
jgi:Zn finger protein HypA/HybF involved in hydrogenase expression